MRLLVALAPVDFRRGIDGLSRVCREVLAADPFSGTVFAFRNRRGTPSSCSRTTGKGFWFVHEASLEGPFRYWPEGTGADTVQRSYSRMSSLCCSLQRPTADARRAAVAPRRALILAAKIPLKRSTFHRDGSIMHRGEANQA